jgi:hypothetical protein
VIDEAVIQVACEAISMIDEALHRPKTDDGVQVKNAAQLLQQSRIIGLQRARHGIQIVPLGVLGVVLLLERKGPTRTKLTCARETREKGRSKNRLELNVTKAMLATRREWKGE